MTDKEPIIIDGVDVSKCKLYRDEDVYSYEEEKFINECCEGYAVFDSYGEFMCYKPCKGQDCYFKQLARKTKECEELKGKVKAYKNLALHIKCPHCNKELGLVFNCTKEKVNSLHRYRKAFEEIEDYVKSQLDGFGNDVYAMDKVAINDILDIIHKAKGGGNEKNCQMQPLRKL